MNRVRFSKNTGLHEQDQHAGSIRPLKNSFVRMNTSIDIYAEEWCNMVFDGKNKEYGAFAIRSDASKQQVKALFIAVSMAVSIAALPLLSKKILPNDLPTPQGVVTISDFLPPETKALKVNIEPTKPLPKPMIRFTAPVISTNVSPEEEMKPQHELINTPGVIGTKDMIGDINSKEIPEEDLATLKKVTEDDNKPHVAVDKQPQLPNLKDYLDKNLHYPALAREMEISGKVIVQFVVGKQGEISNIKVLRGIGGGCDEEAVRVIKEMPKWSPGILHGKFVPVIFTLPITFKLTEQ